MFFIKRLINLIVCFSILAFVVYQESLTNSFLRICWGFLLGSIVSGIIFYYARDDGW